jgi:hypothetical protein
MHVHTIVRRRWFWAWQDHKQEAWFESMSRKGWHLRDVDFLTYTFECGQPKEYVYRLDYRPDKDAPDYIDFVQGAGWQYIGKMTGWLYFRAPAEEGRTAELYTDPDGKIARYKRLLGVTAATSPVYMVVFLSQLKRFPFWLAVLYVTVFVAAMTFYAVSLIKLNGRIKQLQST